MRCVTAASDLSGASTITTAASAAPSPVRMPAITPSVAVANTARPAATSNGMAMAALGSQALRIDVMRIPRTRDRRYAPNLAIIFLILLSFLPIPRAGALKD
jgi:hypothetical protein